MEEIIKPSPYERIDSLISVFDEKRNDIIKHTIQKTLENMTILQKNIGKILTIKCETKPEQYLIGRIGDPPFSFNTGGINAKGAVFTIYGLNIDMQEKEVLDKIRRENIKGTHINFFPIYLEDMIYPRELGYDGNKIPIEKITISGDDTLLGILENLYDF